MPRGVASVNRPTSMTEEAPSTNCQVPISAAALPAWAAWRVSAPTATFCRVKPRQSMLETIRPMVSGRIRMSAKDSTTRLAVVHSSTRTAVRITLDAPKRGRMCGLTWEATMKPAAHRPNRPP